MHNIEYQIGFRNTWQMQSAGLPHGISKPTNYPFFEDIEGGILGVFDVGPGIKTAKFFTPQFVNNWSFLIIIFIGRCLVILRF